MRLDETFYRRKIAQVQDVLQQRTLDGLLLLNHHQIYYLVGFFHYPTERPVALFVPRRGEPTLFVPKLEESFVHEGAWAPDVQVYFEFPGTVHPLDWIAQQLSARGFGSSQLGFESSISVSTQARLAKALPNVSWVIASDIVSGMRLVKDKEEIALMRRTAHYSDWMLSEGVRMVKSGTRFSEIEIEQAMTSGVITKMQRELDLVVAVPGLAGALVCSGPRSAFPHGLPTARRIAPGENLILSVACFVGGYFAESERTFILGEPSREQRHRYETDRMAQEIGFQELKAGSQCAHVNRKCLDTIRAAGLGEFILHRQGHGIGIQNHEPPWIEDGDTTVLAPNMLVSCEPGVYCVGQGGYRISDSVLITAAEPERLTQFPRGLESAVIPI